MPDMVNAARAALCKAPHRFEWWAYDKAFCAMQADNFYRYLRGDPIWTTLQPKHYAFLNEAKRP
jgi:hypothetical protein